METPLQITFKDMESSEFIEARIRERVQRIERFHPHVISCRVVVEVPRKSQGSGKLPLGMAVEVYVPTKMLVAKAVEEAHEAKGDRTLVVNRVFDTMERQLEDTADIRSGQIKNHEAARETGRIARLFPDQSYGFVEVAGGPELYFTANALQGLGFPELEVGKMVAVTRATTDGPMGPQASSVRRLGEDARTQGG